MGRAIELRKTQNQDADSLLIGGRQHGCIAKSRASRRSCVVLEPAHAEKQHAREPGDLWSASAREGTRPAREGPKPQGGRARSGGVGPRHTIDEPDEQRRAIFSGAWGEKGAGQGEHRSPTRHRAENKCPRDWAVCERQQRKGGRNGSRLCFTM